MSDLQAYIQKRKNSDPDFEQNYDSGYEKFKIDVMLRIAREDLGMTQEELAQKLGTKKNSYLSH